LASLNNGDKKYRNIRAYTIFNGLPINPVVNEQGLWTEWSSTTLKSEDEYVEKIMYSVGNN